MQKKRITIPRGSLSPFTASAILQLMQEFNRKEDAKHCLELAKVFKERAAKLKKEPCRQPSKKKKRTASDIAKRAKAFEQLKAGTYIPVAQRCQSSRPDEPEEREWKSLAEYEAWIHQPVPPKASPSPTPTETEAERVYRLNTEMCQAEDRAREAKRRGVDVDDLD